MAPVGPGFVRIGQIVPRAKERHGGQSDGVLSGGEGRLLAATCCGQFRRNSARCRSRAGRLRGDIRSLKEKNTFNAETAEHAEDQIASVSFVSFVGDPYAHTRLNLSKNRGSR